MRQVSRIQLLPMRCNEPQWHSPNDNIDREIGRKLVQLGSFVPHVISQRLGNNQLDSNNWKTNRRKRSVIALVIFNLNGGIIDSAAIGKET